MKSVRCLVLQSDASQRVECRLFLQQGIVVADPPDSPTAQMILGRWIIGETARLTAKDGEEFLEALARNYSGTYLRCSRYEEEV
jgi:hypothetical protein